VDVQRYGRSPAGSTHPPSPRERAAALGAAAAVACLVLAAAMRAGAADAAPATPSAPATASAQAGAGARERIEALLAAHAAYRNLKAHDREAYAALLDAVVRSPHAGASDAVVLAVARTHLVPAALRHMARAENRTAEEFSRNMVAQLRVVAPKVGDACYALLAPDEEGAVRLASLNLGTLDDTDLATVGDAIVTSSTKPEPIASPEEMEKELRSLVAVLRLRYGDDVSLLSRLGEPGVDRARACEVTASLYVAVLRKAGSRKPANVAPLFRTIYSKQAAKQPIG
jgi:hypothetical protein